MLVTMLLALCISCSSGPSSVVNLGIPPDYVLVHDGEEHRSGTVLHLSEGFHTFRFTKDGKDFSTTVRVSGGGELYESLDEKDIHPVVEFKYKPGS